MGIIGSAFVGYNRVYGAGGDRVPSLITNGLVYNWNSYFNANNTTWTDTVAGDVATSNFPLRTTYVSSGFGINVYEQTSIFNNGSAFLSTTATQLDFNPSNPLEATFQFQVLERASSTGQGYAVFHPYNGFDTPSSSWSIRNRATGWYMADRPGATNT